MDECEAQRQKIGVFWKKHRYVVIAGSIVLALPLLWLFWGSIGAQLFLNYACANCNLEKLGQLGDLFGGVNALFAALALAAVALGTDLTRRAYANERQWIRDEKYLEQAIKSYEWAYSVWISDVPPHPKDDRLSWLTCARHLARAQKIGNLIVGSELKIILEEHEEYWRQKFHLALNSPKLKSEFFFTHFNHDLQKHEEGIAANSALVIHHFSYWPDEVSDPLDEIDYKALKTPLFASGLRKYILWLSAQINKKNQA